MMFINYSGKGRWQVDYIRENICGGSSELHDEYNVYCLEDLTEEEKLELISYVDFDVIKIGELSINDVCGLKDTNWELTDYFLNDLQGVFLGDIGEQYFKTIDECVLRLENYLLDVAIVIVPTKFHLDGFKECSDCKTLTDVNLMSERNLCYKCERAYNKRELKKYGFEIVKREEEKEKAYNCLECGGSVKDGEICGCCGEKFDLGYYNYVGGGEDFAHNIVKKMFNTYND